MTKVGHMASPAIPVIIPANAPCLHRKAADRMVDMHLRSDSVVSHRRDQTTPLLPPADTASRCDHNKRNMRSRPLAVRTLKVCTTVAHTASQNMSSRSRTINGLYRHDLLCSKCTVTVHPTLRGGHHSDLRGQTISSLS